MPRKRPSAAEGQAGEVDVERITVRICPHQPELTAPGSHERPDLLPSRPGALKCGLVTDATWRALPLCRCHLLPLPAHASQGITAEHRARQQRQRDQAGGSGAATPIDLDADESETPAPAPVPAEPVASTSKAKSKKRKKAEDADTELVLNTSKAKKSSFADRTPGKFTMCALCSSSASSSQSPS